MSEQNKKKPHMTLDQAKKLAHISDLELAKANVQLAQENGLLRTSEAMTGAMRLIARQTIQLEKARRRRQAYKQLLRSHENLVAKYKALKAAHDQVQETRAIQDTGVPGIEPIFNDGAAIQYSNRGA